MNSQITSEIQSKLTIFFVVLSVLFFLLLQHPVNTIINTKTLTKMSTHKKRVRFQSRYTINANETLFSAALKLLFQTNVARTCTCHVPYFRFKANIHMNDSSTTRSSFHIPLSDICGR